MTDRDDASAIQWVVTLMPPLVLVLLVAGIRLTTGIHTRYMFMDPAYLTGRSPMLGFVSNLGVLGWCSAAAAAGTGALLMRGSSSRQRFWFLVALGLLTAYMTLDDLFMIHNVYLPSVGVPGKVVALLLLATVGAGLVGFRRVVARTGWHMLAAALAFLAVSVLVDTRVIATELPGWGLVEGGAKLFGIFCWLSYVVATVDRFMRDERSSPAPTADAGRPDRVPPVG